MQCNEDRTGVYQSVQATRSGDGNERLEWEDGGCKRERAEDFASAELGLCLLTRPGAVKEGAAFGWHLPSLRAANESRHRDRRPIEPRDPHALVFTLPTGWSSCVRLRRAKYLTLDPSKGSRSASSVPPLRDRWLLPSGQHASSCARHDPAATMPWTFHVTAGDCGRAQ